VGFRGGVSSHHQNPLNPWFWEYKEGLGAGKARTKPWLPDFFQIGVKGHSPFTNLSAGRHKTHHPGKISDKVNQLSIFSGGRASSTSPSKERGTKGVRLTKLARLFYYLNTGKSKISRS